MLALVGGVLVFFAFLIFAMVETTASPTSPMEGNVRVSWLILSGILLVSGAFLLIRGAHP